MLFSLRFATPNHIAFVLFSLQAFKECGKKFLQVQQQKPFSTFFENMLHDPVFADAHNAIGKFRVEIPGKVEKREMKSVSLIFSCDFF